LTAVWSPPGRTEPSGFRLPLRLGGWKSRQRVDRHAKFASENLLSAASRIEGGKGGNVIERSRWRHV
jgi:hypothetical protein